MAGSSRPCDLSLYLVTDTGLCGQYGVPRTVADAIAGGVSLVQVRDPNASDAEFVDLARQVRDVLEGSGVPLIVNDRVHLVEEVGADGAHIGQTDLDARAARELIGPERILGLSAQTAEHIDNARSLPEGTIDYLGIGPVYLQTTKLDAAAPQGLEGTATLAAASRWPCVAIGGITAAVAADVRRTGVDGIAVVSAICGQPDPRAAASELLHAWDNGKDTIA
ncbi:thiamine phosphate synthase [Epidermidibacterium keratini]|uniref:Thiamine-phosphate synthase n=1 Tax=Epidermidibacterium keratini TaxID=1891644 RepID=A0A7L4YJM6_9ACTN|nr:thiamine phosphate synthase [Epidermidibacterium keratini]QHB99435.1 thiamine phosphate synthase [Epidermidibacterium keratini]